METDLDQMTREELIVEVKKLRHGIREHRDSSSHELCWHHPELWGLLPEKTDPVPVVHEWPEFMRGCVRYRQSLDEQAPNAQRTNEPFEDDSDTQHWLILRTAAQQWSSVGRGLQTRRRVLHWVAVGLTPSHFMYDCASKLLALGARLSTIDHLIVI